MNKKILLFSRDPGAANTLIPLVALLRKRHYQVRLFGKGPALKRYRECGLKGLNITNRKALKKSLIELFIKKERPSFIITGTSVQDHTERYLWRAAEKLKIPAFAILDQWTNYKKRFSNLPTKILVMDNWAKKEIVNEGIYSSKVVVTGQPYFDFLRQEKKRKRNIKKLRESLGVNQNDFLITYASEPILKNNLHYRLGYNEKTIFLSLYQTLKKITFLTKKNIIVIIKLHPREDDNNYSDIINHLKNSTPRVIINKNSLSWDLILVSDLICGMSSMFLIEAVLLDKPVLSIQIGLKQKDPFILSRRKVLKSILAKEALFGELEKIIVKNKILHDNFDIINNSTDKVIKEMENYLWKN